MLLLCLEVEQRRKRFNTMSGATPKMSELSLGRYRGTVPEICSDIQYVPNQDRAAKGTERIPGLVLKARVNCFCWWRHQRG